MPEPTTTTSLSTLTLSAVSLLPFINGNALLGAVLGAAFIATYEKKSDRPFAPAHHAAFDRNWLSARP